MPVRWVAQAVSNLLCALKPSSYMQPANVIKIQLPMSSFADSSSVGGKNRVYFSPGADFGVIDIFLLGIPPSSSRPSPAGAAPRGNKCVLNGEVGQSGSALCKACFLWYFFILMCMVKELGQAGEPGSFVWGTSCHAEVTDQIPHMQVLLSSDGAAICLQVRAALCKFTIAE